MMRQKLQDIKEMTTPQTLNVRLSGFCQPYEKYRGPLGNVRKGVLVNPVRTKELTNVRAAAKDENVRLTPPRLMTLEEAIGYVASDELIEASYAEGHKVEEAIS
ncbi:hypothetical protein Taro_001818 [Colocasia esculenta]|uniref:TypA/BipA C-terminal domain-containing protein n=1 Tax=Colocasia esculenta TaxID=4460 RepID=A0A843TFK9_COLES|nr:hypothetical protein [Colocasia esculenta]